MKSITRSGSIASLFATSVLLGACGGADEALVDNTSAGATAPNSEQLAARKWGNTLPNGRVWQQADTSSTASTATTASTDTASQDLTTTASTSPVPDPTTTIAASEPTTTSSTITASTSTVTTDSAATSTTQVSTATVTSTSTTAPTGSSATAWTQCAVEWQTCNFSGTREVRYGTTTQNVVKTFSDGVDCTNANFGDPAPGIQKTCWLGGTTSTSTATSSTIPVTTSSNTTDPSATASAALRANTLGTLAASGAIIIDGTNGATITGRRISNSSGPCIVVRNGATNVTISGNQIGPCAGHGIDVLGSSNIAVTRNNFSGIEGTATVANDSQGVRIRNNFVDGAFSAFRGVRSSQIEIEFNGAINIRGPFPWGQFAQLDNVTGGGTRVQCNAADVTTGAPDPTTATATQTMRTEDIINTWQSRGDASDPILIAYNRLQGGGSFTGSGIMSGDGGGGNISVIGNRIVNPWNAGIGVAGGSNIRVEFNRVFSEMPATVAGEGYYIRNFYPSACTDIVHQNNQIKWPPTDWTTAGWVQAFWQPEGECTNVTGTSLNNLNAPLSKEIFSEPIAECRARAAALGLSTSGY